MSKFIKSIKVVASLLSIFSMLVVSYHYTKLKYTPSSFYWMRISTEKEETFQKRFLYKNNNILSRYTYMLDIMNTNGNDDKISVLLATAGRSGSSFIGDILKKHDQLLYHFEPLRAVNIQHTEQKETLDKESISNEAIQYLDNLYSCNVTQDRIVLLGEEPRSKYTSVYLPDDPEIMYNNPTIKNKNPSQSYNDVCKANATHILIKELFDRFPYTVNNLVTKLKNQNIKILFLVRDPRATIFSFINAGMFNGTEKKDISNNNTVYITNWVKVKEFCTQIEKQYYSVIESKYDFLVIRYEDFCKKFDSELTKTFNFLNLRFETDYLYTYYKMNVNTKQHLNVKKDSRFSTNKDTKSIFQKWRNKIPMSLSVGIEEQCDTLLSIFGYKIVGHNENVLRDEKISLEE